MFDTPDDWPGCTEDTLHLNRDVDPLFVDPSGLDGDFHLQSSAGSWTGSFHSLLTQDSPGLESGLWDSLTANDEGDDSCNVPNLGAYGGTFEASRRPTALTCPVVNTTSAFGSANLWVAAILASDGDVIELADGAHTLPATAEFFVDATVQAAPSASPVLTAASSWDSDPLLLVTNGSDGPLVLSGFQLGSPDHDVVALAGSGAIEVELDDMNVLGSRAIDADGDDVHQTLTLTDSTLGSLDDPLLLPAIRVAGSYQSSTSHTIDVTVEDSLVFANSGFVQFTAGSLHTDVRRLTVTGSELRVGGIVFHESISNFSTTNELHLDFVGNIVLADQVLLLSTLFHNHFLHFENNLVVASSTSSPLFNVNLDSNNPAADSLVFVNNTVVGGARSMDFVDEGAADVLRNNVFADSAGNNLLVDVGNTEFDPSVVEYNLFWTAAASTTFTLPANNLDNVCAPNFPPLPSSHLDPEFVASDWLPPNVDCLVDAGDPDLAYWDAAGDTNDLGASGGPSAEVLPGPSDLDADGFGNDVDCDDLDASDYPGAPELCDGEDNDCDGVVPDDELDLDTDGAAACEGDCAPQDPTISPLVEDTTCDGVDVSCGQAPLATEVDEDGDGHMICAGDCLDSVAAIHPGAIEVCDAQDTDCDGGVPADEIDDDGDGEIDCMGDCDDADDTRSSLFSEACDGVDNDCDNVVPADEVDGDVDGYVLCAGWQGDDPAIVGSGDCSPSDSDSYPGAPELCDGGDNDCTGGVPADEDDLDGDSFYTCSLDCDDLDGTVYPGAPEVCDGQDNDCDDDTDEGLDADVDGDGYNSLNSCANNTDCADLDGTVNPGATELCDGLDTDCDGAIPGIELDSDADGWSFCEGDCEDGNNTIHPGADEVCNNLDDDCDEEADEGLDVDGDGQFAPEVCVGGLDCDDNDPAINTHASEVCDGVDNDCDGELMPEEVDLDGDGESPCEGDCDDTTGAVNSAEVEVCDGVDNDCDGTPGPDELDSDGDGSLLCDPTADCDDQEPRSYPGAPEVCDGLDNDCENGVPDIETDFDNDGYFEGCSTEERPVDCNDENAEIHPGVSDLGEVCDGVDNNCRNGVDEVDDADGDGYSPCTDPADCQEGELLVGPFQDEVCDDLLDNDCDGDIDESEAGCLVPVPVPAPGFAINCSSVGRAAPAPFLLLLPLFRRRSR